MFGCSGREGGSVGCEGCVGVGKGLGLWRIEGEGSLSAGVLQEALLTGWKVPLGCLSLGLNGARAKRSRKVADQVTEALSLGREVRGAQEPRTSSPNCGSCLSFSYLPVLRWLAV